MRKTTTFLAVAGLATATGSALASGDEHFQFEFKVEGGQSVTFEITLADNPKVVTGFTFVGIYDDQNDDGSWASDMRMEIDSSDGQHFDIGGFDNPSANLWDFDGPGSDGDGTYSHDGHGTFDNAAKGVWTVTFINDWVPSGGHTWFVELWLHKIPSPGALALLGVAGLMGGRRRRR